MDAQCSEKKNLKVKIKNLLKHNKKKRKPTDKTTYSPVMTKKKPCIIFGWLTNEEKSIGNLLDEWAFITSTHD